MELYWLSASRGEWGGTPAPGESGDSPGAPEHALTIPILCPACAKLCMRGTSCLFALEKWTKSMSLWSPLCPGFFPWSPAGCLAPCSKGQSSLASHGSWACSGVGGCVQPWPSKAVGLQLLSPPVPGDELGPCTRHCPSVTPLCVPVSLQEQAVQWLC